MIPRQDASALMNAELSVSNAPHPSAAHSNTNTGGSAAGSTTAAGATGGATAGAAGRWFADGRFGLRWTVGPPRRPGMLSLSATKSPRSSSSSSSRPLSSEPVHRDSLSDARRDFSATRGSVVAVKVTAAGVQWCFNAEHTRTQRRTEGHAVCGQQRTEEMELRQSAGSLNAVFSAIKAQNC